MNKELEELCDKEIQKCVMDFKIISEKHNRPFDEPECLIIEGSVRAGFEATSQHYEERVKGLLEPLKEYCNMYGSDMRKTAKGAMVLEALKDWEGEK